MKSDFFSTLNFSRHVGMSPSTAHCGSPADATPTGFSASPMGARYDCYVHFSGETQNADSPAVVYASSCGRLSLVKMMIDK
jgi:hypothetical protein